MQHKTIRALLVGALLAVSASAFANDADIAAKLPGNWEGEWKIGSYGGKLTAKITGAEGDKLKGEATWFGTQVGDLKLPFSSAKVKDGKLIVDQPYGMGFEGKLAEDAKSVEGGWSSSAGNGPFNLKKVD